MAKIRYIRRFVKIRRMFRKAVNRVNYKIRLNHVLLRWYTRKFHDKLDDLFIKLFYKKRVHKKV